MVTDIATPVSKLIKRRVAAEMLDVTTRTLRRYELSGRLPPVKLNSRATRYKLDDVLKIQQGG